MQTREGCRRLIFVDVDGVLSAPRFDVSGGIRVGMPEEDWLTYCIRKGQSAYDECAAVPCMSRYLEQAQDTAGIYVLTAVLSSFEADAKRRFVREKYPNVCFDGVICVGSSKDKIPVILAIAKENGFFPGECELIEDDYSILIDCLDAGIRAKHVANVAAEY